VARFDRNNWHYPSEISNKSITLGNLSPLNDLVPKDKLTELKNRFDKVMSLKNYDINNVQAGREYIEAYVQYFHFAEGEGEHNPAHIEEDRLREHIPWILSGIFVIISVLFGTLYYRKK